jgi:hypothetical protein
MGPGLRRDDIVEISRVNKEAADARRYLAVANIDLVHPAQ